MPELATPPQPRNFGFDLQTNVDPFTGIPFEDMEAADTPGILGDSVLGVFRGVAGAIENTIDLIPGVDLPENLGLGHSQTGVGAAIEGITSFATGFIPVAGLLGRAGAAAKAGSILSRVGTNPLARGIVAGAAADFLVFDGNDPRLSNLIESVPGLSNPITSFLQSEGDDSEILGRMKNVIEGAGLGVVAEGVLKVLGKLKTRNKLIESEAPKEQIEVLDEAIAKDAEEILQAPVSNEEVFEDAMVGMAGAPQLAKPRGMKTDSLTEQAIRSMDLTADKADELVDLVLTAKNSGENPLDKIEGLVNLAMLSEAGVRSLFRAMADEFDFHGLVSPKESLEQSAEKATRELGKMVGQDPNIIVSGMGRDGAELTQIRRRTIAYQGFMDRYLNGIGQIAESIQAGKDYVAPGGIVVPLDRARETFASAMETGGAMIAQFGRIRREAGRLLGNFRISVGSLSDTAIQKALEKRGGVNAVNDMAGEFLIQQKMAGNAGVGRLLAEKTKKQRLWALTTDMYYASLLSGVKTLTTNYIGSYLHAGFRGFERAAGAMLASKFAKHVDVAQARRVMTKEMQGARIMAASMIDTVKYAVRMGNLPDSVKYADQARRTGQSSLQLGEEAGVLERPLHEREGFSRENISSIIGKELDPDRGLGKHVEWMSKLVHYPSRWMLAGDDHVKQMVYHAKVMSELTAQGHEAGLRGRALDDWADIQMAKMTRKGAYLSRENLRREFDANYPADGFPTAEARDLARERFIGKHLNDANWLSHEGQALQGPVIPVRGREAVAENAYKHSVDITFQKELSPEDGVLPNIGRFLQQFTRQHPWMVFFATFVRTPINLLQSALERLPVPGVNPDVSGIARWLVEAPLGRSEKLKQSQNRWLKQLYSDDPEVVSDALGRFATITATSTVFGSAAAAGIITGRGPSNPDQRRVLEESGWRAKSIKIGDSYVSYERLDPFASLLGFYGDVADLTRHAEPGDWSESLVAASYMAMGTNLEDKSYIAGLMQLTDLITDPEHYLERTASRIVGAVIPSLFAQFRTVTDDKVAELNGVVDRVFARIPGFSDQIADKRRNILGEPMTQRTFSGALATLESWGDFFVPLSYNHTSTDAISLELASLAYPFSSPAPEKYGVNLKHYENEKSQSAYDRWQELVGEVQIGGKSVRQSISRLISSNAYQALPNEGLAIADEESPRIAAINRVVGRYRRLAERKMLEEFPELKEQARSRILTRQALKSGRDPAAIAADLFPLDN